VCSVPLVNCLRLLSAPCRAPCLFSEALELHPRLQVALDFFTPFFLQAPLTVRVGWGVRQSFPFVEDFAVSVCGSVYVVRSIRAVRRICSLAILAAAATRRLLSCWEYFECESPQSRAEHKYSCRGKIFGYLRFLRPLLLMDHEESDRDLGSLGTRQSDLLHLPLARDDGGGLGTAQSACRPRWPKIVPECGTGLDPRRSPTILPGVPRVASRVLCLFGHAQCAVPGRAWRLSGLTARQGESQGFAVRGAAARGSVAV
jgi:hypothetical protein